MFCPECGKKNKKEAKFCEFCGSKIIEDKKIILPKKKKTSMPRKTKIIIGIVIALVVIVGGGGAILFSSFTPSKVATDYFVALMSNDTDKLYDYLDIPENEFTTEEIFSDVVNSEDEDLVNYSVTKEEVSSDGLSAQVTISYTIQGSSSAQKTTIYLVKDSNNKFLIFDNWKISEGSSLIEEDYEIKVFKGSTLKLEGITVSEDYKTEEDEDYDTYVLPALFTGEYSAEITLTNGLTIYSTVDVGGYTLSLSSFDLSDDDKEVLEEKVKEDVTNLYQAAIDGEDFDDIKDDYEYEDGDLEDLEDAYSLFAKSIDSSELKKYTLTDLKIDRITIDENGYLYVTIDIDYDYTVKEYFSDDTVSNSSSDTAYLTYDYNEGFKLVDMSSLVTYFSRF